LEKERNARKKRKGKEIFATIISFSLSIEFRKIKKIKRNCFKKEQAKMEKRRKNGKNKFNKIF